VSFRVLVRKTAIVSSPALWVWLMIALVPITTLMIASALPTLCASFVRPLTVMRDEH
jgi:hypothetical protein